MPHLRDEGIFLDIIYIFFLNFIVADVFGSYEKKYST